MKAKSREHADLLVGTWTRVNDAAQVSANTDSKVIVEAELEKRTTYNKDDAEQCSDPMGSEEEEEEEEEEEKEGDGSDSEDGQGAFNHQFDTRSRTSIERRRMRLRKSGFETRIWTKGGFALLLWAIEATECCEWIWTLLRRWLMKFLRLKYRRTSGFLSTACFNIKHDEQEGENMKVNKGKRVKRGRAMWGRRNRSRSMKVMN
jgi:hypothetical protein